MALIRLRICAGWSEALLVEHTTLLEIACTGSINWNKASGVSFCFFVCSTVKMIAPRIKRKKTHTIKLLLYISIFQPASAASWSCSTLPAVPATWEVLPRSVFLICHFIWYQQLILISPQLLKSWNAIKTWTQENIARSLVWLCFIQEISSCVYPTARKV